MTQLPFPPSMARGPSDEGTPTPGSDEWFVRVPAWFRDDRRNPITKRHRAILILLDGRCRDKCYCWVGNDEGAEELGCTPGHFRILLSELHDLGEIHRVIDDSDRTKRLGIVLRRRVDEAWPVADDEASLAAAIEALTSRPRRGKSAPYRARKSATYRARKSATELESCREQDEWNQIVGAEASSRRRPETTRAEATPAPRAEVISPPAAPPAEAEEISPRAAPPAVSRASPPPPPPPATAAIPPAGLTAPQREVLGRLNGEELAKFLGWTEKRRASELAIFAAGIDEGIFRAFLSNVRATRSIAPPPPPSTPTPELIACLSGPMGTTLVARCASAILSDLADRNASRSFGPVYKYCSEVVLGTRDPDSLAEPLAKTLDALARGQPIKNPGGYWTRGVQNWDRERGGPAP